MCSRTTMLSPVCLLVLATVFIAANRVPAKGDLTKEDEPILAAEQASPLALDCGQLQLEIYISRTATLFHVIDQISAWDEATHAQYRRYFERVYGPFSARDRDLLAKHAGVRRRRGWGGGLEQAFYTHLDLESAIKTALEQGYLTAEHAATETEVIMHFAPKVKEIMQEEMKTVLAFRQRLVSELDRLRNFSKQISRFCHGVQLTMPVYLMVNPADRDHGGGYNGGRLTVEVPRAYDVMPVFLHELMHAFIGTQREYVEKAAQDVEGLSRSILNEGICYALSPGIIHAEPSGSDPLLKSVVVDVLAGKTLQDGGYPRDRRYGLALRPLLRQALEDETQTLKSFLPKAVHAWLVIREMDPPLRTVLYEVVPERMPTVQRLTISRAYWFYSKERPESIPEDAVRKDKDGHILIHVEERPNTSGTFYRSFYGAADKNFILRAAGYPDVKARAERGYWNQEFYLRVPKEQYQKMVWGVSYALQPVNWASEYRWHVREGVTITKSE